MSRCASCSRTRTLTGAGHDFAQWCEEHGFQYAHKTIPDTWLKGENDNEPEQEDPGPPAEGGISWVEANDLYRVGSLTRRIADLREAGHKIASEWRRDLLGQKYTRYSLVS